MTLNRNKDQYVPFLPRSADTPARCFGPACLRNNLSQKVFKNVPCFLLNGKDLARHMPCRGGEEPGKISIPFSPSGACGLLLMFLAV